MRKVIFVLVTVICLLLLFGCDQIIPAAPQTYCGDSELGERLPEMTYSDSYPLDIDSGLFPCDGVDSIKGQLQGAEKITISKYIYNNDETNYCTNGDFCSNIVTLIEFRNRENVDAYIEMRKTDAERNGTKFYVNSIGTNKVYYDAEPVVENPMTLYTVTWTSGKYLINIYIENTYLVNRELRDKLLGEFESDVSE